MSGLLALTAADRGNQEPGSPILVNPDAIRLVDSFLTDNGRAVCTRILISGAPSGSFSVFVTQTPAQIQALLTGGAEG